MVLTQKMSVHQSSPPVQFVDYCSACLVKDWCKNIAPSCFLDVIFNCWRDCGLATCQAPSTLIEPLTRNYAVHISVAIVLLGAVSHSSSSKLVLQMHLTATDTTASTKFRFVSFFFEHNCTPSGKKTVTGVQVTTAS